MLKVGQIEYANCTPLFRVLRDQFSTSNYEFVAGVPAELNRMLLNGTIDVCPSSSIEYALHPDRYKILPQLSISSIGPVASVLLFSKVPVEKLDGMKILLSAESATSVNLLKVLLAQYFRCHCSFELAEPDSDITGNDFGAILLIGDSALKASAGKIFEYEFDLGEIWNSWTGLPFVFALWFCRNEVSEKEELKEFADNLIHAKNILPDYLDQIAETSKEAIWMGKDRLLAYWRNNILYDFDQHSQAGLMLYYKKCYENGLISGIPELHFISPHI